jgi:photosystem II stability/assembly factor-like uncharacterized protein
MRRWVGMLAVLALAACSPAMPTVVSPVAIPSHPTATATAQAEAPTPIASVPATSSPSPLAPTAPDAGRFSPASIAFFDARHGLIGGVSAGDGVIWRTIDGGRTYAKRLLPTPGIVAVTVIGLSEAWAAALCTSDAAVGCRSVLLHSADAGRTWAEISTVKLESISFVDPEHGWAIGQGIDPAIGSLTGSLVSTKDGGRHWVKLAADPCAGGWWAARSVVFTSLRDGWVGCRGVIGAGWGPRAIAETINGGRTWRLVAAASPPGGLQVGRISSDGYLTGLAMRSSGIGVYWADRGVTEKTADGGRLWSSTQPSGFDTVTVSSGWLLTDRDWLALVFDGSVGGNTPQVLEESTDGGHTWRVVSRIPLAPS